MFERLEKMKRRVAHDVIDVCTWGPGDVSGDVQLLFDIGSVKVSTNSGVVGAWTVRATLNFRQFAVIFSVETYPLESSLSTVLMIMPSLLKR